MELVDAGAALARKRCVWLSTSATSRSGGWPRARFTTAATSRCHSSRFTARLGRRRAVVGDAPPAVAPRGPTARSLPAWTPTSKPPLNMISFKQGTVELPEEEQMVCNTNELPPNRKLSSDRWTHTNNLRGQVGQLWGAWQFPGLDSDRFLGTTASRRGSEGSSLPTVCGVLWPTLGGAGGVQLPQQVQRLPREPVAVRRCRPARSGRRGAEGQIRRPGTAQRHDAVRKAEEELHRAELRAAGGSRGPTKVASPGPGRWRPWG